ncbi:MAG: response regulator [Kiritimatiellia bacterium]
MKTLILIADDDARNRMLLTDVLESVGLDTVTAENGREAIALARTTKPAVIVMDVQMPVMDGLAAVAILKADPTLRAIPVIAITALAMAGDRERLLAAGFDWYLSKPVNIKEVRAVVASLLDHPSLISGQECK